MVADIKLCLELRFLLRTLFGELSRSYHREKIPYIGLIRGRPLTEHIEIFFGKLFIP